MIANKTLIMFYISFFNTVGPNKLLQHKDSKDDIKGPKNKPIRATKRWSNKPRP